MCRVLCLGTASRYLSRISDASAKNTLRDCSTPIRTYDWQQLVAICTLRIYSIDRAEWVDPKDSKLALFCDLSLLDVHGQRSDVPLCPVLGCDRGICRKPGANLLTLLRQILASRPPIHGNQLCFGMESKLTHSGGLAGQLI